MCDVEAWQSPMWIEIWFGPSSTLFRVASLYSFDLEVEDSSQDKAPAVRFQIINELSSFPSVFAG